MKLSISSQLTCSLAQSLTARCVLQYLPASCRCAYKLTSASEIQLFKIDVFAVKHVAASLFQKQAIFSNCKLSVAPGVTFSLYMFTVHTFIHQLYSICVYAGENSQ